MAKILVVDDEPHILEAINDTLSGFHEITTASNGDEALVAVKEKVFDVILLDVMMPPPDGFEVCSILKGSQEFRDIPIVFLTAKGQLDEIESGLRLGAHAYIVKPFSPRILIEKIQRIVES